jgi:hypothetical protein
MGLLLFAHFLLQIFGSWAPNGKERQDMDIFGLTEY